jgi:acyl-CoA synthetase (AMP-forming)/AMP-acid ligase II
MIADGCVQIVDRTIDVIKSGGAWISSIELENTAVAHPAFREAAVVARPDACWARRRAVPTPSVDWLCPVATPRPSVRAWRPLGIPDQHREGHLVSIERLRLQFARGDATDRGSRLREGGVSVAGR